MKTIKDIKPKEIKSNDFEVKIEFTNHEKYGLVYKNSYLYIKCNQDNFNILEIDTKFDNTYEISLDTLEWLYYNNRLLKKDKRKIKMIINQLKLTKNDKQ